MSIKPASPGRQGTLARWLDYISAQHSKEIALGLERVREVAQQMHLLPLAPRNLIVAGTNGKGSTVRFAEALLLAQGYRVGATLSPHMHRYNERVRIDGAEVDDAQLVEAFHVVDQGRNGTPLTYYEFSILAAFWLFREAKLDVCVLEVGLGGRLDVTNLVDAEVAVVTSIGLDHQSFLGDTLEEIGAEKAAVCRRGAPLLLGGDMPVSVLELAKNRGAAVLHFGRDFWYQRTEQDWTVRLSRADFAGSLRSTQLPRIALRNAALATAAVARLSGTPTAEELERACGTCVHPGRFEMVRWQQRSLILDVAHNPASARFLARQLRGAYPGASLTACGGFLADKDVTSIVAELAGLVTRWVFVTTTGPRGLSADKARDRALNAVTAGAAVGGAKNQKRAKALSDATLCDDAESGLAAASACAGKTDIIVAFGSFQMVQLVREQLFPAERVNE